MQEQENSDSKTNKSIKGAVVFEPDEQATQWQEPQLQAVRVFEDTDYAETEDLSAPKEQLNQPSGKPKKRSRKLLWLFAMISVLGLAEIVLFTRQALISQDLLSALWLVLLAALLIFISTTVVREYRSLKQLKKQQHNKQHARNMLEVPAIGQAESFCLTLAEPLLEQHASAIETWQTGLQAHYTDDEILRLFDLQVLGEADKRAMQCVSRHASASAAMIAVSPFALLDMAIVLWRNLVMLNQVSRAYGIELSYWGRIALIRRVFKTMLYAGASEIIADAGNYALSAGVTGKLSTRLAQGLGAGVLTSRIGVKAMGACRPLPWIAKKPPGLSRMAQQILADLKKLTP